MLHVCIWQRCAEARVGRVVCARSSQVLDVNMSFVIYNRASGFSLCVLGCERTCICERELNVAIHQEITSSTDEGEVGAVQDRGEAGRGLM